MNGDQAIKAGVLAIQRRELRKLFRDGGLAGARINFLLPGGKTATLEVDRLAAKALMEGVDLNLSTRLSQMGVSELDETPLLPAPRHDLPHAARPARLQRRPKPGPDTRPAG